MSRRANNATLGNRSPARCTNVGSRFPPSQLWLINRATLPIGVASILIRKDALPEGKSCLATSRACPLPRSSYAASLRRASCVLTYSPTYSHTKAPAGMSRSATAAQPLPLLCCRRSRQRSRCVARAGQEAPQAQRFPHSKMQAGSCDGLLSQPKPVEGAGTPWQQAQALGRQSLS